nr:Fe(2+) transporter permease subunit FeoB [uncultured Holophaga sp.]
MSECTIALAGNPNCGKTTLFNALTGTRQRVGNWPGVTVDRKSGEYDHKGLPVEVVDLPGIYSLSAASLDEKVSRDYLLSGDADLVVNILDASNLERNLYLTVQLLEMRVPMVVALNMMDLAKQNQVSIDVPALEARLGCPVIPLVAARQDGLAALRDAIAMAAPLRRPGTNLVDYPVAIQEAVATLLPAIEPALKTARMEPRWGALKLLESDPTLRALVGPESLILAEAQLAAIEASMGEEADILMADSRYEAIGALVAATVKREGRLEQTTSDRIDKVVLSRIWGIPIFLVAMYLMFMITINLGGAFIDFFDQFAGAIFVDGFGHLLGLMGSPEWLTTLLAKGLGGGVQTMATFIPPIGFMFLCLCILEDSGYMARAAFVMDRFMRLLGLPGKAFVPLLVGFGCNVPATMATRTLENQRDRTLSIAMIPFMSCGARLPVYALFAAAFFPASGQNIVFGLYLLGIAFAVFTGLVLKNTLLKGEITPFVMELPPYHIPSPRGILVHAWDRLKAFLFRAGKLLVPLVMILSFFNSMGPDGSFGNEQNGKSVLSAVGRSITPIFKPLGIKEENWPATVGIFTGIFAKEAVVGTLNSAYTQMKPEGGTAVEAEKPEEGFHLGHALAGAFATIPEKLKELGGKLTDPLGISVGDVSNTQTAAEEQKVDASTFGAMVALFDGKAGAFAYLMFILLYFPCAAAIAAVYRETNLRWTLFVGAWTTGLAYLGSTVFYQAATFGQHPAGTTSWIVFTLVLLAAVIATLRHLGQKAERMAPLALGRPRS